MMYQAYQFQSDLLAPWRWMADQWAAALWPWSSDGSLLRKLVAALSTEAHMRLTHQRPAFGIDEVKTPVALRRVHERVVTRTPFASLLHFDKPEAAAQPPVLLVAPLSGHFATLLRETARTLLQDHAVYVTDWHNARDVPLAAGRFGLDEYIEHLMQFIAQVQADAGRPVHVVAVCQPCVAALAATALMAEDEHPATPRSLTLMAGPVDCRVNPTTVNRLATGKPLAWFEDKLIARVPAPHAGFMRRVYPGFVQLAAFMSMNLERHQDSLRGMYEHWVAGDLAQARATAEFYDEYLAVNDLPAEFYLETVEKVFQTYDLARGRLQWRGRRVRPEAIRRTWLLTVEGERDDICAVGQTVAAQDLCSQIRPYMKTHHVQVGVGHYGVFSGRRWNEQIYPRVRAMIHDSEG